LIVDDPDAPRGFVYALDRLEHSIQKRHESPRNSAPTAGVQGTNDFGKRNYGGPCPPLGTHRYFFKIFALDTKLELKNPVRAAPNSTRPCAVMFWRRAN